MEPLLIGALTGMTAVVGVAFWQAWVRPWALMALWSSGTPPKPSPLASEGDAFTDPWFDATSARAAQAAIRAVRMTLGALLLLVSFLTGLTLVVLLQT